MSSSVYQDCVYTEFHRSHIFHKICSWKSYCLKLKSNKKVFSAESAPITYAVCGGVSCGFWWLYPVQFICHTWSVMLGECTGKRGHWNPSAGLQKPAAKFLESVLLAKVVFSWYVGQMFSLFFFECRQCVFITTSDDCFGATLWMLLPPPLVLHRIWGPSALPLHSIHIKVHLTALPIVGHLLSGRTKHRPCVHGIVSDNSGLSINTLWPISASNITVHSAAISIHLLRIAVTFIYHIGMTSRNHMA